MPKLKLNGGLRPRETLERAGLLHAVRHQRRNPHRNLKPKPSPTLINRSMSTVRRVTVENGQVVVVGRDGKIERILLSNVVRMSISP